MATITARGINQQGIAYSGGTLSYVPSASVQAGDLMIVMVAPWGQAAGWYITSADSHWTLITTGQDNSGGEQQCQAYYKIAGANESSNTYTWSDSGYAMNWIAEAFYVSGGGGPILIGASSNVATAGTKTSSVTLPAITVHANAMVVMLESSGATPAATFPSGTTAIGSNATTPQAAYFIQASAGSTGTQLISISSSQYQAALMFEMFIPPAFALPVQPTPQRIDWNATKIYAQRSSAESSLPPVIATVPFFAGFETGDFSEFSNTIGTVAIDSSVTLGGAYSVRMPWGGTNNVYYSTPLNLTTAYVRSTIYTTAAGGAAEGYLLGFNSTGGTPIVYAHLVTDGVGGVRLRLWNHITGAQIGSDYTIAPSTWYTVEVKLVVSATVGVAELRVNGTVIATGSGQNTGSNAIVTANWLSELISGTSTSGNVWHDNVQVNTQQYPGVGYVIARQIQANGVYNQWSYSSGTQLSAVISKTPVSATGYVSTATASNEFSGVVDFTSNTGFGTGVVGSNDTVNAFKIAAYGQTNSTVSDGADSTIFHSGGDILTPMPSGWTTNAAPGTYLEAYSTTVPSAPQVRNLQVGIQKGSGTNLHLIYDLWAMVDYAPVTTGPTLPQEYATFPLQWNAVQTYAQANGGAGWNSSPLVAVPQGNQPPPVLTRQEWNATRIYAAAGNGAWNSSPFLDVIGPRNIQPYLTQQSWNALKVYAQAGKSSPDSSPLVAIPGGSGVQPILQQQSWNAQKVYAEAGRSAYESSPLVDVPGQHGVQPYPQRIEWNALKGYAEAGRSAYDSSPFIYIPGQNSVQPYLTQQSWNAVQTYAQAGNGAWNLSPRVDVPGEHSVQPIPSIQPPDWRAVKTYAEAGRSAYDTVIPPTRPLRKSIQFTWLPFTAKVHQLETSFRQPTMRTDWNAISAYAQAGQSAFSSSALVPITGQQSVQPYTQRQQWDAVRAYAQAGRADFESSAAPPPVSPASDIQFTWLPLVPTVAPFIAQAPPLAEIAKQGVQWDALRGYAQAGRNAYDSSPFVFIGGENSIQPVIQQQQWNALKVYAEAGRNAYDSSALIFIGGQNSVQPYPTQQRWDALRGYAEAGRAAFDSSPYIDQPAQHGTQPYPTQVRWDGLRAYAEAGRSAYDSSPFIPLGFTPILPQPYPTRTAWNALDVYAEVGSMGGYGPPVVPPAPLERLRFAQWHAVQNLTIQVLQVSSASSIL